jgi:hypothetical protein
LCHHQHLENCCHRHHHYHHRRNHHAIPHLKACPDSKLLDLNFLWHRETIFTKWPPDAMDSERRTMVPPKQNYQTLLFVEGVPLLLKVRNFSTASDFVSPCFTILFYEKIWILPHPSLIHISYTFQYPSLKAIVITFFIFSSKKQNPIIQYQLDIFSFKSLGF